MILGLQALQAIEAKAVRQTIREPKNIKATQIRRLQEGWLGRRTH